MKCVKESTEEQPDEQVEIKRKLRQIKERLEQRNVEIERLAKNLFENWITSSVDAQVPSKREIDDALENSWYAARVFQEMKEHEEEKNCLYIE